MGRARGSGSWWAGRPALLLLLLAALLLRAGTPPGWMPNPQGALGAPMVICTAEGSQLVQLDGHGQPAKPRPGQRHDLCAFAGHHAAPAAEVALASDLAAWVRSPAPAAARRAGVAPGPRHREQAPRAPPTFV